MCIRDSHNGNGYIGVRSNFEEGYPEGQKTIRGSYINGFYDFMKMPQAEKLLSLIHIYTSRGRKKSFQIHKPILISTVAVMGFKSGRMIWKYVLAVDAPSM